MRSGQTNLECRKKWKGGKQAEVNKRVKGEA